MRANRLALAGLRARHPHASKRELPLRLAVLRPDENLVFRACGWRQQDGAEYLPDALFAVRWCYGRGSRCGHWSHGRIRRCAGAGEFLIPPPRIV